MKTGYRNVRRRSGIPFLRERKIMSATNWKLLSCTIGVFYICDPVFQAIYTEIIKCIFVANESTGMILLHPFQCLFGSPISMLLDITKYLQTVNQHPMPPKHPFSVVSFYSCKHLDAPVDICIRFGFCFLGTILQIRKHLHLECFSTFLVIHNKLSVKNLDEITAIKFSIKIRSGIYENIQLNVVNKRCVMESFMVIRNNQCVKITVQIVCSVRI